MKPLTSHQHKKYVLEVERSDRWQIYRRLQELDIPCSCETNQPLTVEISSVTAAIQVWSVARQLSARRQDLVHTLRQCWRSRYKK